ncbi:MAG: pantoate--beta-alanine ligase [Bacteroidales bacterium]|jgi:pantoate--beta-alanine ligase|nr:pantoate--beta-alanine ligase [Bacteroidales bacterium]
MNVLKTCEDLRKYVEAHSVAGNTIGFVPTMGALHNGHLSLLTRSVKENDVSIVSVFVNPIQFNNKEDLRMYPRTLDKDITLLESAGCNAVFVPEVAEMYPEGEIVAEKYDFGSLETVMEAKFRPGHFNGVAVVVKRLFDIAKPTRAYFGLKDFQQLAIIKSLVNQYDIPVEIVSCEIVREEDGLAMSSRNVRLKADERKQAARISHTLFDAVQYVNKKSVDEVRKFVINAINSVPLLSVEYFDLVDAATLQSIDKWDDAESVVGCIAVNVGEVRLIDAVLFL